MNDLCQSSKSGMVPNIDPIKNQTGKRIVLVNPIPKPTSCLMASRFIWTNVILVAFCAFSECHCAAIGQDWPQINGPNRNGIAEQEKLLGRWPADGDHRW